MRLGTEWHADGPLVSGRTLCQVTVVDASQFLSTLRSHDSVAEAGLAPCDEDARTLAHLLIDQVSLRRAMTLMATHGQLELAGGHSA